MKLKEKLYRLFLITFLIVFIIIFIGTIFDNKNIYIVENPIYEIIGFIIVTLAVTFVYKKIIDKHCNKLSLKREIIIVSIIFIVFGLLQLLYGYIMASHPGWDWNDVMNAAMQYVYGNKEAIDWPYFQMFPNNNSMLYIEIVMFKFLKVLNLFTYKRCVAFSIVLNIFSIDLSALFLYLTTRELFGKKQAILSLILCMISYGYYCYVPVFYTDTLTMLFPILILFLYVKHNKENHYKYLFLLVLVAMLGYKIKPTVIISLIAIIIDIFLKNKNKDAFKKITTVGISVVAIYALISVIEVNLNIFPYDIRNNTNEMPYTHWIMMGMTERNTGYEDRKFIGWYNPESMNYTLSYKTTEERKQANIKQIKKQFKEYGPVKYICFLYRKMLFAWSDGTYFEPSLVNNNPMMHNNMKGILREFTILEGKYYKYMFRYNIGFFLLMYLFIILGVIKRLKNKDNSFNYSYLSIFGLVLFLLIWETSSRYLLTFTPVLLLCTISGFNDIIGSEKKICLEKINEKTISSIIGGRKKMKKDPILYVVIPCYNEEEVLTETTKQLKSKMEKLIKNKKISPKSKVMYVNDGSKDKTWQMIQDIHKKEPLFTGVTLSRNRGHQNALLGGLMTAKNYADVVISMDADLQDDINAIDEMIQKYKDGNDIVYGVRSARKKDTFFKRVTAEGFYKFMKALGVDCVYNHADYRLTSKRVLEEFANFKEVNLFLRGMFPLVGFKSDVVYYERNERFAGESKYPLKKMLNFAWDGITSFSVKPLRLICTLGFVILFVSIVIMVYSLIRYLSGNTVSGWTFLSISLWFIGGLQMISTGIIGEYIGKMYSETKQRPRFIIAENLEEKK